MHVRARWIRTLPLLVLLSLAALLPAPAIAQLVVDDFLVRHDFQLTPGGTITPQVTGLYYLHAYVLHSNPYCADSDVLPPGQPIYWDDLGWDIDVSLSNSVGVRNCPYCGPCSLASLPVSSAGTNSTFDVVAEGSCAPQYATATAEIEVLPFGPGTVVAGHISSYGLAQVDTASPEWEISYAFGMAAIQIQGGTPLANGTIDWLPTMTDAVSDSAFGSVRIDPINFIVEDLQTSQIVEGSLFSVKLDLAQSDVTSYFRWVDDLVEIGVGEVGRFEIDRTSPFLTSAGYLELEFDGSMVSVANGTGVYAGVLPPVGTPLPLVFTLTSAQALEYDLGDFSGHDLAVQFFLGGSSESTAFAGDPLVAAPIANPGASILLRFDSHPNPFNPRTTISYELKRSETVRLQVFDVRGRLIRTLVQAPVTAGLHEIEWDGRDSSGTELGSGVYHMRLEVAGEVATRRVTLVR